MDPEAPSEQQTQISLAMPEEHIPFLRRLQPVPFAVLSLCIIFFLYQVVGGILSLIAFKGSISEENVHLVRWITLAGQLLFILGPTLLLARTRRRVLGEYLRLRIPDYREIVLSVVAVFALQQLLQGYMVLQDSLPLPPELRRMVDQFEHLFEEAYKQLIVARSPVEFVYVVIVVALVPAVCEELLFRGLVQRSFEAATDGLSAAIVTGVIFGAYHLNPFAFVPLAALGTFFGFIVYRSQNITVAISAHFFNNFVACAAVYMRLDEEFIALAPAGDVTPEVLFFNYVLFGAVFVVSTYYFMRVTEPPADARP